MSKAIEYGVLIGLPCTVFAFGLHLIYMTNPNPEQALITKIKATFDRNNKAAAAIVAKSPYARMNWQQICDLPINKTMQEAPYYSTRGSIRILGRDCSIGDATLKFTVGLGGYEGRAQVVAPSPMSVPLKYRQTTVAPTPVG